MLTYKIDPFPGNIVQITTKDRDDIHADCDTMAQSARFVPPAL